MTERAEEGALAGIFNLNEPADFLAIFQPSPGERERFKLFALGWVEFPGIPERFEVILLDSIVAAIVEKAALHALKTTAAPSGGGEDFDQKAIGDGGGRVLSQERLRVTGNGGFIFAVKRPAHEIRGAGRGDCVFGFGREFLLHDFRVWGAAGGAQAEAREMADERGDTGKGDW